jgi:hypothetical protein
MAASETFEWYVWNFVKKPEPHISQYIRQQRLILQSLRSEDERQRFVDGVMGELRMMQGEKQQKS